MKNNNLKKGITLTETIIVVAIFALVAGVIGTFQRDVFFLTSVARGSLTVSQDARNILKILTKELREAGPSANGAYPIVSIATSTITFYSDSDADGKRERIRYFISSTTLMKGKVVPTGSPLTYSTSTETYSTVVENVRNGTTSIFSYYDTSYAGTTTALTLPTNVQNVRLIKINLILDVDARRAPVQRDFTTQVSIRNLKDNL